VDYYIINTNSLGDVNWSRTFGGVNNDMAYSILQTTDGGFVAAGETESFGAGEYDFWMIKMNAEGDSLWSRTFGGSNDDRCYSIQQTSDGGFILAGETVSFGSGSSDFWLVKTGPELAAESREELLPEEYALHQNYPNPFNPSTRISYELTRTRHVALTVYDVLGREVATLVDGMQTTGNHNATFDGSELASGIYLCRLQIGEWSQTRKLVLLK
jgi:hypothetical protein